MRQQKLGRCALALAIAVGGVALAGTKDDAQPATLAVLKDDLASPGTVRASKLIGSEVLDPAGKDVGKIRDIVLGRDFDRIDYAVLGQGRVNEKLLALPYRALHFGGPSEDRVYVQVPEDVLDKAPGFDEDKWPTASNADYYRSLDTYYSTHLSGDADTGDADVAISAQKASAGLTVPTELPWTRRATKLIGRDVLSSSGEKLGSIKDLVLDTKTGDVRFAVLAQGGGLEKSRYYAVPLDQFRARPDDKKLTLDISEADLKAVPSFDNDHWPAHGDPRWITPKDEIIR